MNLHLFIPAIISLSWLVWAGYWLISARNLKPVIRRQSLGSWLLHRLMMIVAAALLLYTPRWLPGLRLQILPHSDSTAIVGAVICVAGAAFAIWARTILAGNWSGTVTVKENHELIQRGPYALVRHPIYTGILLLCLGTAVAQGNAGPMLGVFVVFMTFWLKLLKEEQFMMEQFPMEYPIYKVRVKRLIPFVL